MTESAEAILERQRALARARRKRWVERHPDGDKAQKARYLRAERTMRDRHREEFLLFAATRRQAGESYQQSYRSAKAEMRRRYPDEWADVLAATS